MVPHCLDLVHIIKFEVIDIIVTDSSVFISKVLLLVAFSYCSASLRFSILLNRPSLLQMYSVICYVRDCCPCFLKLFDK